MPKGTRTKTARVIEHQMLPANGDDFPFRITPYTFRHLYANRMKDTISLHRLALIMRTSVAMLEKVYGIATDESNYEVVTAAVEETLGPVQLPQ